MMHQRSSMLSIILSIIVTSTYATPSPKGSKGSPSSSPTLYPTITSSLNETYLQTQSPLPSSPSPKTSPSPKSAPPPPNYTNSSTTPPAPKSSSSTPTNSTSSSSPSPNSKNSPIEAPSSPPLPKSSPDLNATNSSTQSPTKKPPKPKKPPKKSDKTTSPTSRPQTPLPTVFPTSSPTLAPIFYIASIKPGSKLFVPAVMVIGIDIILFILCVAYLLCFSNLLERTQMPGTATVMDTIKMLGTANIVAVSLEIFDIVTDYLYAVDLITNANELGWIALMSAILGLLLFGLKMVLTKKLIGFQEYNLERQLERDINSHVKTLEIIKQIRQGRLNLDVVSLLIACIEDIPQALIITMVVLISSKWDAFGLLSLSLAILSFCTKLLQIIASKFGCKDTSSIRRMSRISIASKIKVVSTNDKKQKGCAAAEGQKEKNGEMVHIVHSPICLSATDVDEPYYYDG